MTAASADATASPPIPSAHRLLAARGYIGSRSACSATSASDGLESVASLHFGVTVLQLSHVDSGIIGVWRWQAVIATLFIVAVLGPFSMSIPGLFPLAPATVLIGGALLIWRWPPLAYKRLRFGVDETGIAIESGVIWRSRIALPRVRIQHTDVSQGPLERHYGIGTLKLYTAGSRHTRIELPGLQHEEAIALRDALLSEGSGSGV